MNLAQLKQYILNQLVAPVNSVQKIINVFNAVVDYFVGNQVTTIIPDWNPALNFKLDGTDAGKFCLYPDTDGNKRIFETKVDNNSGNAPPSAPNMTENTYWIEVSQAGSSAIVEWEPKLYGAGLVIVFHDHSADGPGFYQLLTPTRPFNSTNLETELTDVPAKWRRIGGVNSGGPAIAKNYTDIAALIADQADQEENALYFVSDASTDPTVDSGWALYRYLGTTAGTLADYQKLSEEESLDILFNVLGTTLTGYSTSSGTISASDTILQAFNKIGYFIANIAATVRSTVLTGFASGSNAAISATDSVLQAFQKVQGQLNAKLDASDVDRTAVAISSGTLTLDLNNKRKRRFQLSSTASSNFTIALSNTTNVSVFTLDLNISGTVAITMPSTFRMSQVEADFNNRWNSSTRVLTLTGDTDSPFELSATYDGAIYKLKASQKFI